MQFASNTVRRAKYPVMCASALAIALAGLAPGAAAQTSEATADQAKDAAGVDIVVTGTRVIRDGFQAPTPLTVLTEEQLQDESPTNNLADFLNQIPSVAGSTRLSNSRLNLSDGSAGLNTVNLRNLGSIRTLALIDGRRSVASSVEGFVDINTFPQGLVKSVEIVTGGASAAYGSDAVAGVINFILDKKYTGLKASGDVGVTDKGDGFNYSGDLSFGRAFAGGRGHILLSGEITHRDGIFEVDRDWNQLGYRTITNLNASAANGQPANLVRWQGGSSNLLPGGIINASTSVAGSGVPANSLRGLYFGPGGSVNQYDYGIGGSTTVIYGGDWALSDTSRRIGLDPQEDRYGVFGRASFELAPWIEVFGEVAYNWQKTLFSAGMQQSTSGASVTYKADNAFLINTLGAQRLQGISQVTIGTTSVDLPYRESANQRDTQRYVLGAGGDIQLFGNRAVWGVYGQYGETNTHEQLRNIMINDRMGLAVDAVFAPAGNAAGVPAGTIVCRSTLTNPSNGCVPLNRLGIGVASQEAIDWVLGDPYRDQKFQQTVFGFNLSTTPFATWAGDVSVALGGEYRNEEVSGYVPPEYQSGFSVGNYLPTFGSYNVKEAYLETVIPLGLGIEFNGAVRGTDYSTSGYVTTWKAGGTWQPIPDIRLRASISRDIRAPNLNELFQAGTSRSDTLTDRRTNPPRQAVSFREITTGNLNLRPEKANSLTVGGVLQPRFIPGFSFSADYFRISLKDKIGQYFAQDIINRCAEGLQEFCDAFEPDPTGARELFFRASYFNFSRQIVRGLDFETSYRRPVSWLAGPESNVTLRGVATRYIDNIIDTGVAGVIPVNTVGANSGGTPKWIFRASASLDTPSFRLTAVGRGVSAGTLSNSYVVCQTGCPATSTQAPTIDYNHASGLFYADLNLTAKIGSDGRQELFFNVTNLFDRWPMLLPEGGTSANTTYSDLLGRAFRVGFRLRTR